VASRDGSYTPTAGGLPENILLFEGTEQGIAIARHEKAAESCLIDPIGTNVRQEPFGVLSLNCLPPQQTADRPGGIRTPDQGIMSPLL
jgi:hypothetical protein